MSTVANSRSSQSSRFYTPDGHAVYEIPKKRGDGMKKPTVVDARENGWLPSVTTVSNSISKPALENWLREQACLAVLTTPRNPGEEIDAFVNRVLNVEGVDKEEARLAADKGTAIHAAIKDAMQGKKYSPQWGLYVAPVMDVLESMGKIVWSEKVLVGDGYAGRSDVLCDDSKTLTLCDFKTTRSMPKNEPYKEAIIQVAAYAETLGNVADRHIQTAIIYISTTMPGVIKTFIQEDWKRNYEEGFLPLLKVWQYMNSWSIS